jgi:hypothetical protein
MPNTTRESMCMVKLQAFTHVVLDSYYKGLVIHFEYATTGNENLIPTATSRPLATTSRHRRKRSYLEKNLRRAKKRVKSGGMATNFQESMVTSSTKGQKRCSTEEVLSLSVATTKVTHRFHM